MMNPRVMMKPRLLIVDDDDPVAVRSDIKHYLDTLPREDKQHYGIEDFQFDEASDYETAMQLMRSAKESFSPYTLVLLDLELPRSKYDQRKKEKRGFDLLKYAVKNIDKESQSAQRSRGSERGTPALGAIVISNFHEYENVVTAFELGAVDFIGKKDGRVPQERLQQQVLAYFKRQVGSLFDQRIKNLIPHAQKGLANRLSDCLQSFERRVREATEGLKREAEERWGLDPIRDLNDTHIRHLLELDSAVENARKKWQEIQSPLLGSERKCECILEALLEEIQSLILPCLMLKKVELINPNRGQTRALSFDDDVYTVLFEILLGALCEITDHDTEKKRIELYVVERNGYAEVRVLDNLAAIPHEQVEMINETSGSSIKELDYGRVWGLSLAQFVAKRGGGRLTAARRGERGNAVTYKVPLAS